MQSVLLYGAETWVITDSMMKVLEGFHLRVARRLAGMLPRLDPRSKRWHYPKSAEVLELAGLWMITQYVELRRNRLADYVAT